MENCLLTLFTPTYNRARLLGALYKSILAQPNKDKFEWLIVDDGSTDNTKGVVAEFVKENKINIRYVFQENKGKASAFNFAANNAMGRWLFCIDSDDVFVENSLINFFEIEDKFYDNSKLAGILTARKMINSHEKSANHVPVTNGVLTNFGKLRKKGFTGEPDAFFKIHVLKEYPFPIIEGEKFTPETSSFDLIDTKYLFVFCSATFIISEYQTDGYTINRDKIALNNPKGMALWLNQRAGLCWNPILKLKYLSLYCAFEIFYGGKRVIRKSSSKLLCLIAFPVGYFHSKKFRKRYKKYTENCK